MICQYGMLFQLYPLPNLNPHHPQFITKSYGTSCLHSHTQAREAQLTQCKGITFSDYLQHAHTNYNLDGHTGINLGVWYAGWLRMYFKG